ncbi:polymeric immunoglobulin receptor isoform X3 [Megalobrama amblycephala]|uniref:polymeric immunoglobulin receptor isoform X3 n=1 Tax=Megalobrama amblycephala TaxID=75352 RepID=UPI002014527B|nr:polymeric immunoglobulin receptor isoform X3 [Megalobrama amblycephala]
MAFLLSTLVLLLGVQGTNSLWTVQKITAQTGGSVTIPCHYHRTYRYLPMYWCKGKNWITCKKMQPTSQEKKPGISFYDSPDELVTAMTMTNLSSSDSNRYWCIVRTPGSRARTSLELTVIEGTPDLSVASNWVSGEEGGNVTVQCLYSNKLIDDEKKWCRSGELHSCQTAQDIEPSPGAALQINDTNDGVYTVTLTGLKKTDSGWFWCMAGGVQAPVHINVHSRQLITDANTRPSTYTTAPSFTSAVDVHNHNSVTPVVPTKSQLPQSTSIQTENPDQTSTASPKQFYSTIESSTYLTTTENSKENPSHSSGTIRTPLTSRSATPYVGSNSTVTVSSKDVIFEPTPTYESRELNWEIALVCGGLLIFFMLSGVSWKLWSWHQKEITKEEATEITTDLHTNDRNDLLANEWTNTSVVQFSSDSNAVLII